MRIWREHNSKLGVGVCFALPIHKLAFDRAVEVQIQIHKPFSQQHASTTNIQRSMSIPPHIHTRTQTTLKFCGPSRQPGGLMPVCPLDPPTGQYSTVCGRSSPHAHPSWLCTRPKSRHWLECRGGLCSHHRGGRSCEQHSNQLLTLPPSKLLLDQCHCADRDIPFL